MWMEEEEEEEEEVEEKARCGSNSQSHVSLTSSVITAGCLAEPSLPLMKNCNI